MSALFSSNVSSLSALLCSLYMIPFTKENVIYRVCRYGHMKLSRVGHVYTV